MPEEKKVFIKSGEIEIKPEEVKEIDGKLFVKIKTIRG